MCGGSVGVTCSVCVWGGGRGSSGGVTCIELCVCQQCRCELGQAVCVSSVGMSWAKLCVCGGSVGMSWAKLCVCQ